MLFLAEEDKVSQCCFWQRFVVSYFKGCYQLRLNLGFISVDLRAEARLRCNMSYTVLSSDEAQLGLYSVYKGLCDIVFG